MAGRSFEGRETGCQGEVEERLDRDGENCVVGAEKFVGEIGPSFFRIELLPCGVSKGLGSWGILLLTYFEWTETIVGIIRKGEYASALYPEFVMSGKMFSSMYRCFEEVAGVTGSGQFNELLETHLILELTLENGLAG